MMMGIWTWRSGSLRDDDPTHINQSSIVLINDGTGQYTERVVLPLPQFYQGYTAVQSIGVFDLDDNGFEDLFLLHTRNDDLSIGGDDLPFTRPVHAGADEPGRSDVHRRDGDAGSGTGGDAGADGRPREATDERGAASALQRLGSRWVPGSRTWGSVDRNHEAVTDRVQEQRARANSSPCHPTRCCPNPNDPNPYFGHGAWPADVNGDGLTDFVASNGDWGPDEQPNTEDDGTVIVVTLNTNRATTDPVRVTRATALA